MDICNCTGMMNLK